jgi:uncharacterized protein
MTKLVVSEIPGGVEIDVIAKPKARKVGIVGVHDGALRIAVTAAPEKGKANDAIAKVLADSLDLPVSAVSIIAGHGSRRKRVRITGVKVSSVLELGGIDE